MLIIVKDGPKDKTGSVYVVISSFQEDIRQAFKTLKVSDGIIMRLLLHSLLPFG